MTTDAEKAALKWLDCIATGICDGPVGHAHSLKALLAEPRLPAEPSDKAINAMLNAPNCFGELSTQQWRDAYRALYAHLTAPKTKTVEVWHVEYTVWACDDGWQPRVEVCGDKVIAEGRALGMQKLNGQSCIHVTGPHAQEIPA